jgi:K(+)-stimulated pyrophosphate-energized sodium pump
MFVHTYQQVLWGVIAIAMIGILLAGRKAWEIFQIQASKDIEKISEKIRRGAKKFLHKEYRVVRVTIITLAVLLSGAGSMSDVPLMWLIGVPLIAGAALSFFAGHLGMRIATMANAKVVEGAKKGLYPAFVRAFNGGAVMGLVVGATTLGGLAILLLVFDTIGFGEGLTDSLMELVSSYSLGASVVALFARVGGGIFTKAADIGADLVGKIEAGIPEDDPRNPATIADNVGDNVGDVAGMGADLFESFVEVLHSLLVLGAILAESSSAGAAEALIFLPVLIGSFGLLASIVGVYAIGAVSSESTHPQKALNRAVILSGAIFLVLSFFGSRQFGLSEVKFTNSLGLTPYTGGLTASTTLFLLLVIGLVAGISIGYLTEYFTSGEHRPVKQLAEAANESTPQLIIAALALGKRSTVGSGALIATAMVSAYTMGGLYGIAFAGLGMMGIVPIQLAIDAYGPIADNAGGIAEMTHQPEEVRERTDTLDAVGNTTAAIGKGFAIGSAALTALALFSAFVHKAGIANELHVMNPWVTGGTLLGAGFVKYFVAATLTGVNNPAKAIVEEVRRQFREIPGLLKGETECDSDRVVEIATEGALREMVVPSIATVLLPIAVGMLSLSALGGFIFGAFLVGTYEALELSNFGGAADNAKKLIEAGLHGGKGSNAHKAAVIGDTVGDPTKDTSGPALNIVVKLTAVVSLVIAPLLVMWHAWLGW